ncbi:MAG: hypothetical protein AAFR46_19730, partial [Pseudomonadota bacterium]
MSNDVTGFRGSQPIAWSGELPADPSLQIVPLPAAAGNVSESWIPDQAPDGVEEPAVDRVEIAAQDMPPAIPVGEAVPAEHAGNPSPPTRALELAEVLPVEIARITHAFDAASVLPVEASPPDSIAASSAFTWRPILNNSQAAHIVHETVNRRIAMEAEHGTP